MYLRFKYRIYPTRQQADVLTYQLREACDLYNCALQERIGAWKTCRKSINFYEQCIQLRPMRAEGLIGIPNYHCSQDILHRLDKAFKAFFRRIKNGEKPGFPRFKPSRRYDTLTFPRYGDGCKLIDRKIRIQGVGEIKIKLHRPVEGIIRTVSIQREAGRWFVSFSVIRNTTPLPTSTEMVGVDLGVSTFATLSDGTEVDTPQFLIEEKKRLRVAARRFSRRRNKNSNRRRKALLILQRQFVRIQNQRADFHHKFSNMLVNRYGLIVVENLNVKGMSAGILARAVKDAGWGIFLRKLSYKAESAGREFITVNPSGTSQTCLCGARVPKTLSQRWHSCSACGLEGARDHISAQLILRLGLSLRNITWPEVRASVLREATV